MDEAFAKVGIKTAEELREIGADAAYARLLANGQRPHFIGYYVLVMGLQGRPWNDCKGKEKDQLRATFDALKAAHKPEPKSTIWSELEAIGIVDAAPKKGA